ncbi:MAG TPA: PEP-utilizing enzyme, partial [Symbiobacteriaceae bacterium]|nr:PEP-utilizing enzyme [Symbiobacteriaceae bacterium]
DLMAGIDHASARIQAGLEALAESIRTRPALVQAINELEPALFLWRLPLLPDGLAFAGEFAAFLDRYGCRELYYGGPSWGEAPEAVVGILRSLLTAEVGGDGAADASAGQDPGARFGRASRQAEAALPFLLRPLFRRLLHLVRSGEAFMEESHWQLNRPIPVMRAAARELGRRLARRGLLPDAADVFYLIPTEIAELVRGSTTEGVGPLIARRKRRLEAARRKGTLVPMQYLPGAGGGDVLKGVPVGCGQVTARVRVIRSEADFGRLRRGEVLVAPYTNPAWTPLFSLASAVVVDTGGAASHAAIVAREYAIPAVMGTRTATTALTDGDLVQVDGMAGTVRIVQRAGQRKER